MRTELADAPRRRAPRGDAGRSCSRTTRSTSSASPCRPSCTRRSRSPRSSAGCTCCPRSRSRARRRRRTRWSRRRARAGRVLDVAFNHRQRGDIQTLQPGHRGRPARPALLREGVVAAAHRDPDARQLVHQPRAGGRRAAAGHRRPRARLRAVPARAAERSPRSARRPTTCSARAGFGSARDLGQDRRGGGDVRRRGPGDASFMRLDDGGTLLVEASWAAHRTAGDEFGITIYGTEGGAELRVRRHGADRHAEALHRRRRRARRDEVESQPGAGTTRSSSSSWTRSAPARAGPERRPRSSRASSTPATARPRSGGRSRCRRRRGACRRARASARRAPGAVGLAVEEADAAGEDRVEAAVAEVGVLERRVR